jgi:4-hydroxy-2-oxovalerate/4-hydroxy-2-oxohexanoate aldolase
VLGEVKQARVSALLFAKRAEAEDHIPAREILDEPGRQRRVGGQQDMIEDTALARQRGLI